MYVVLIYGINIAVAICMYTKQVWYINAHVQGVRSLRSLTPCNIIIILMNNRYNTHTLAGLYPFVCKTGASVKVRASSLYHAVMVASHRLELPS